jgi:uncharacterized protein YciI
MFLVLLQYKVPLAEIDALMKRHVAFLETHHASGLFVTSGRRLPRTGGVILAKGDDEAGLREIMASDPFISEGAADFEVIQFRSSLHAAAFAPFADRGTRPV